MAMHSPLTATIANAGRHPAATASVGSAAPARAAPPGTPVCLMENVRASRCGGAVRDSSSEEAGVMAP